ncbi:hypothetical protein CYLTODRAFT_424080 [Cylindrobasidium torrendii FP15055 ss-10]|uniref:F-box domain-containing protein n=1 Tax=Cylindrobasidium torrendii FP15055 ss-10 TaxID=1314674 RepID=A0A0D7B589_9AGAR|nr:hypothetical protein CYLTODRAFT_424080 [Cylindrobasidium torrendii FP15055 ss-10]
MEHLPNDILLLIFQECADATDNSLAPDSAPWSLASTCSAWRAIVLNSPLLWTTLRVPLDDYGAYDRTLTRAEWLQKMHSLPLKIAARTRRFLELSKNCLLDIEIEDSNPNKAYYGLARIIGAESARWRTFVGCTYNSLLGPLRHIPHLTRLELRVFEELWNVDPPALPWSCVAPKLKSAAFIAMENQSIGAFNAVQCGLPLEQLTSFKASIGPVPQLIHRLLQVTELDVKIGHDFEPIDQEEPAIRQRPEVYNFPNLVSLTLDLTDDTRSSMMPHVEPIISRIHAPSLTSLNIYTRSLGTIFNPTRIKCTPERLVKFSLAFSDEWKPDTQALLIDFLKTSPNLEVLGLQAVEFLDYIFEDTQDYVAQTITALKNSSHAILPKLSTLQVDADTLDAHMSNVLEFVLQRSEHGGMFKELAILVQDYHGLDSLHPDAGALLESLEEGYHRLEAERTVDGTSVVFTVIYG